MEGMRERLHTRDINLSLSQWMLAVSNNCRCLEYMEFK